MHIYIYIYIYIYEYIYPIILPVPRFDFRFQVLEQMTFILASDPTVTAFLSCFLLGHTPPTFFLLFDYPPPPLFHPPCFYFGFQVLEQMTFILASMCARLGV